MKKLLAILMAVAMLMSLAACGGTTADPSQDPSTESTESVESTESTEALEITGWNSLNGLTVSFQSGTTAQDVIDELTGTGTITCTTKPNEKVNTCFEMLGNGEVQAIVIDSMVAEAYVANDPDKYKIAWKQEDQAEEFGIAVPKGSTELQVAINAAMAELTSEGFMTALSDKWFGSGAEVTMPTEKTITYDGTLLTEGYLTMGCELGYPPFEDTAEDGTTAIGYDIDLMKAIAIKMGLELNVINTAFDTIFEGMGSNYDVVASAVTINADRLENMDFSDAYIKNYQAVVVKK